MLALCQTHHRHPLSIKIQSHDGGERRGRAKRSLLEGKMTSMNDKRLRRVAASQQQQIVFHSRKLYVFGRVGERIYIY